MSVYLQSWKENGGDKNEEKNFHNKSSSLHCYHFITPYRNDSSYKK